MFKKLIKYLYNRFCEPDIVSMTRLQLGLFDNPINIDKTTHEEQEAFCERCQDLLDNPTFNQICNEVVDGIKDQIFHNTESKYIIYDRFSINGISLMKERMEKYISAIKKREDEYNQYEIL